MNKAFKKLATALHFLKKVLMNSHGIFSFSRSTYNDQIAPYYKEILSTKGGGSFRTDKENLRSDFRALKLDINKAYRCYRKCM